MDDAARALWVKDIARELGPALDTVMDRMVLGVGMSEEYAAALLRAGFEEAMKEQEGS